MVSDCIEILSSSESGVDDVYEVTSEAESVDLPAMTFFVRGIPLCDTGFNIGGWFVVSSSC